MSAATASPAAIEAPLVRKGDGAVVAPRCEIARTFGSRFMGLMGRSGLRPGAALWIEPCNSIHMMFVRFRIDVVFVDEGGRVLKVAPRVMPWLGLAACRSARATVELEAGTAERLRLAPGDVLELGPPGGAQ
jgi:uncharacterized protein